jgi:hypothetical protein
MSSDHKGYCLYCGTLFTEQTTGVAIRLHETLLNNAKRFYEGDLSVRAPNSSGYRHPAQAKQTGPIKNPYR